MTKPDKDPNPEDIDPAHLDDVLESLAQAKRGEFASGAEVKAAFGRFELTDAQVAEVELAKREVCEGQVATEEEMNDLWRRFGL
jgi:predicted transcriptional regulator